MTQRVICDIAHRVPNAFLFLVYSVVWHPMTRRFISVSPYWLDAFDDAFEDVSAADTGDEDEEFEGLEIEGQQAESMG